MPDPLPTFFGVYRAVVTSAADPTARQRLLVRVPDVLGDVDVWAEACIAAESASLPDTGALVWVAFESGSADRPVWLGRLAA